MSDLPESNYFRVNVPGADKSEIERERQHVYFQTGAGYLSGVVNGTMTVLTPLHVGTGEIVFWDQLSPRPESPGDPLVRVVAPFIRENGHLCIPGSSLKGAFRHLYEAITKSCLAQSHRPHRPANDLTACRYRADTRKGHSNIELCPACRVFGAQGYLGHVRFQPAVPEPESLRHYIEFAPQRWEPEIKPQYAHRRKIYTHGVSSDALMEPLEVLDSGTRLNLSVQFHNLTPFDLGVLLLVFGQGTPTIYPKLGAAKAYGFGAVEITRMTLGLIKQSDYVSYDTTSPKTGDFALYLDAIQNRSELLAQNWQAIAAELGQRPEGF